MEHNSTEAVVPDSRAETGEFNENLFEKVKQYVTKNPKSTNTRLFSFLALLKAYVPESYLLMPECQKILGPPDPIHGGPPFEERMMPFTAFINTSSPTPGQVGMTDPVIAQRAVELLADLKIFRSATMKNLMTSLCGNHGDQLTPHILQFTKDLLTKRELEENDKEKFSRLIEDMEKKEGFYKAVSVLEIASRKFRQNPIFPQTLARLYYLSRGNIDYDEAEKQAKIAIKRAPNNSYVADTLGQIYKNRLMRTAKQPEEIRQMAKKAFDAFKDVEMKAEKEEGPELEDAAGTISISNSFNNRGRFGFIQVAKIKFAKLKSNKLIRKHKMKVEVNFDFFEWYLTYSMPDKASLEPPYFWEDVALCYKHYTEKAAAESTTFPGLLDHLNHGLFTSKGKRAGFEEGVKTAFDLEAIQDDLRTTYEANVKDSKAAERYILSNIILSNRMQNSPQLTPVNELQTIIQQFLGTDVGRRSPEFYLLALLLFWPEEEQHVLQEEDDEEVEPPSTEDDASEDQTGEDEDRGEEQETGGETAQPSLVPDLQHHLTLMKEAFERAKYAKYLRGRYLLPLFFLGKGSGLSKWIHKSRLDAIVEEKVDAELDDTTDEGMKERWINDMWITGEVFQVPEIQEILLPVQVKVSDSPAVPQEHGIKEVFVCAGGKKIMDIAEAGRDVLALGPEPFYLGFTIQGPVIFSVRFPHMSGQ